MSHDEDAYPGDAPEENHDGDQHDVPDDDGGTTPDGASDAEESEDDSDEPGHTRMTLDEIRRRAEEKYGHLSDDEAAERSRADLQQSINRIVHDFGPDPTSLIQTLNDAARIARPGLSAFAEQVKYISELLDSSAFEPAMPNLPDLGWKHNLFDQPLPPELTQQLPAEQILRGIRIPTASTDDPDPSTGTDQPNQESTRSAPQAQVAGDAPGPDLPGASGPDRRTGSGEPPDGGSSSHWNAIVDSEPELASQLATSVFERNQHLLHKEMEQARESLESQAADIRTLLETMREQTASVHKTADAMNRQLKHAERAAQDQHDQHQEAMTANRWSLGVSAGSVLVAMATLIFSVAVSCSQQNQPVEVEWQAPPASSTPGTSSEGATSPPQ